MNDYLDFRERATRYTTWEHGDDEAREEGGGYLIRDLLRFFAVDIIALCAVRVLLRIGFIPGPGYYVSSILATKLILLCYLFWLIQRRDSDWESTGATTIGRWWTWPVCVAAYVLCFYLMIHIGQFNQRLLVSVYEFMGWVYLPEYQDVVLLIFGERLQFGIRVVLVIFAVLIGPFMEELAFRGVGMDAFWRRWGTIAAVICTSVLFGIFHFGIQVLLPLTIMGAFFALVRIVSGSLWCAIFIHSLHNAVTLTVSAFELGALAPQDVLDFLQRRLPGVVQYLPEQLMHLLRGGPL